MFFFVFRLGGRLLLMRPHVVRARVGAAGRMGDSA